MTWNAGGSPPELRTACVVARNHDRLTFWENPTFNCNTVVRTWANLRISAALKIPRSFLGYGDLQSTLTFSAERNNYRNLLFVEDSSSSTTTTLT
jgi:hypothetical protein